MDWTEKYRPRHIRDLVGNIGVLQTMVSWAQSWSPKDRPLILYGKPGTGKTSAAHALAGDMGWDIIELNASDQRTKAALEKIAGSSALTAPLSGAEHKLIVLDEVDNLHGTADRGGAKALLDIIKKTQQPMILIANILQDVPAELRSRCEPLQFRSIQARSLIPRLRFICAAEHLQCSDTLLEEVSTRAEGDVRAAITMLQAAAIGKKVLTPQDLSSSSKDERSTIFDLIGAVFRGRSHEELVRQAQATGETPERIVQWLEGSVGLLPDYQRVAQAYRSLRRADLYLGRTIRRQYYLLWRYAQAIAVIGMAEAAQKQGIHARISPPTRWQRIGSARRQRAIRGDLLHRLSSRYHIPERVLREEYLTLFSLLVEHAPEHYVLELDLDADALNLFLHDRERSVMIVKKVKEEGAAREKMATSRAPRKDTSPGGTQSTLF
ncbi:MAG: replication factor C large subunit [Methanomicrobiales archaeon]|nr:replication factor C large subunit [Methanomicrobiales archaeon]